MSTADFSGLSWRKSSRSTQNGSCVELAIPLRRRGAQALIAVRDSKNPTGPMLMFNLTDWQAFTDRVKVGEFDGP